MDRFFTAILPQYETFLIKALRVALSVIFVWFGVLKIFGYNPVYDIIYASFPWLADGTGLIILGAVETLIGAGLLLNFLPRITHVALILHLLGTLTVFISGPEVMFQPFFPVLTLAGEFVFKNVALALSGLVVMGYRNSNAQ